MKIRSNIAIALTLIGIGAWFLAVEIFPALKEFSRGPETWPLQIIAIGAGMALLGLVTWTPGMMIPAVIASGVGGLLYWQNSTGEWGTWTFAWALIPAFVGAGIVLAGLMERDRDAIGGGAWTILVGMVLFAIFGAFLGGSTELFQYWPVLLIVFGMVLLARGALRKK